MSTIDDEPTVVLESTAREFYTFLRPAVRAMARRMEDELRTNDHKGDWGDCRSDVLYSLLQVEMDELAGSIVISFWGRTLRGSVPRSLPGSPLPRKPTNG